MFKHAIKNKIKDQVMISIWTKTALSVRGESTAIFHLLLIKEVIGAKSDLQYDIPDLVALYVFLPTTLLYNITNFLAMYIFSPNNL